MEFFVSKKDFLSVVSLKGKFTADCNEALTKCAEECSACKAVVVVFEADAALDVPGFRPMATFLRALRSKSAVKFVGASPAFRRTLLDQGFAQATEFVDSLPNAVASLRGIVSATQA